ncbi:MAG: hypothetical protein WDN04_24365 [Rhodospirillales bacterium]
MAPDSWKGLYESLLAQVKSGQISAARLDDAVRRILRVKVKAGLFGQDHQLAGHLELLGSPSHRAVARTAVRESLVLLKNDGALPIRGGAEVLVAGDGADNIGKQCGGWTISWQGTGNRNSDFPQGQSIYAGIEAALARGGGPRGARGRTENSPGGRTSRSWCSARSHTRNSRAISARWNISPATSAILPCCAVCRRNTFRSWRCSCRAGHYGSIPKSTHPMRSWPPGCPAPRAAVWRTC